MPLLRINTSRSALGNVVAILLSLSLALFAGLTTSPGIQEQVPLSSLPFSPARRAGPTLYVSGQIARTSDGIDMRASVAEETRQTMENIQRVLSENEYALEDVVNVTVYLKDIGDYQEMNKVYASYFKNGFPARATVGGAELVFGFRVEISCVAYKN